MKCYYNGELVNLEDVTVSPLAFSLHYAVSAFEGIRSYEIENGKRTAIFRLEAHAERLVNSCVRIGLRGAFCDKGIIERSVIDTVKSNGGGNLYVRPIAYFGTGIMSVRRPSDINYLVIALPVANVELNKEKSLVFSDRPRDISTIDIKISRNYFDSYMSLHLRNPDLESEILQFTSDGYVTETSAHNIFFQFESGEYATPSKEFCLEGVTRNTVLQIAKAIGTSVSERPILRQELKSVRSCFLTSTAGEVVAIRDIQGVAITNDCSLLSEAIKVYGLLTRDGQDIYQKGWLSHV